jgi:hypothetical protein
VKIGELLAVLENAAGRRRATPRVATRGRGRTRGAATLRAPSAGAPRAALPPTAAACQGHDVNLGAVQGSGTGGA